MICLISYYFFRYHSFVTFPVNLCYIIINNIIDITQQQDRSKWQNNSLSQFRNDTVDTVSACLNFCPEFDFLLYTEYPHFFKKLFLSVLN